MATYKQTFTIMLPHEELDEEEEIFECTFEGYAGSPQTYDDPGEPAEFNLVSAYATRSGPVNRIGEIPADEITRIEKEMASSLEEEMDEPSGYDD
jgi:hypothetical protein